MAWCLRAVLVMVAAGAIACGGGGVEENNTGSNPSPTAPSDGGGSTSGCTRPDSPSGLRADVSGSRVLLSWNAVNTATQYDVLIGSVSGSSNLLATNTTQTSYNWNGAPRGRYYARVEAKNQCGNGPPSAEVAFDIAG
jgi:hypothetical protein